MSQEESFRVLLAKLKNRDPSAAEVVFHENHTLIVRRVRRWIGRPLRGKIDEESVAASAVAALFVAVRRPGVEPAGWEGVWKLLVRIARLKFLGRVRRFRAGKRNVGLEQTCGAPLPDVRAGREGQEGLVDLRIDLRNLVDRLTAGFDEAERRVIEMWLLGYSAAQTSADTGIPIRTVERIRKRFKERLREVWGEGYHAV